jgi:hypothetical protein
MMPNSTIPFKSIERDDIMLNKQAIMNPSLEKYIPDVSLSISRPKKSGEDKPFGVNTMRFKCIDYQVPGAGTYKLPESCKIREPKYTHASIRS